MIDPQLLPKDPRHQRFADLLLQGTTKTEAYRGAFPSVKQGSCSPGAARLLKRPDVQAYMAAIRQAAASKSALTVAEKREFCARVLRCRVHTEPDDSDLWQEIRIRETEDTTEVFRKLPSKTDIIRIDNELDAESPAHNALDGLAKALATLGAS